MILAFVRTAAQSFHPHALLETMQDAFQPPIRDTIRQRKNAYAQGPSLIVLQCRDL